MAPVDRWLGVQGALGSGIVSGLEKGVGSMVRNGITERYARGMSHDQTMTTPDQDLGVGPADLEAARRRLEGQAHRTPVLTCHALDQATGARLFFKCENFQRIGAFKFRGAYNTIACLTPEERSRGVVTHSSGNHAQAVALAARLFDIPARVVMPRDAPAVKRRAVEGYGAEVMACEPTVAAREAGCREVIERTGATLVHPYDDPRIIAGQGTAALELLEEVGDLDLLLVPVGGGGLASGTAIAAHAAAPGCEVWGAEPSGADDAARSLASGRIEPSLEPATIADGLRGQLGQHTFRVLRRLLAGIVTVSEPAIVDAMRRVWERMKIVIEPSAAVPLAALLDGGLETRGRRVGIVISGGNVDLDHLPWNSSSH